MIHPLGIVQTVPAGASSDEYWEPQQAGLVPDGSRYLVDYFSFVIRAQPYFLEESMDRDKYGLHPVVERSDENAVRAVKELLGLSSTEWQVLPHGRYGYLNGITYGPGINIYWGGKKEVGGCAVMSVVLKGGTNNGEAVDIEKGVCVEMSGQGCRAFETYGSGNFGMLYQEILYQNEIDSKYKALGLDAAHLTRFDVAFDDRDGLLDMTQILEDCRAEHWRGRFKGGTGYFGFGDRKQQDGIEFGSKQSLTRIRIYDKAAERGYAGTGMHWVRCELQLRDERANQFAQWLADGVPVGQAYCSVLRNYLQFCAPVPGSSDTNKRRWPVREYWETFLCGCSAVSLCANSGVEYNMKRLERYVGDMAGNAVVTYLLTHTMEEFITVLDEKIDGLPVKYQYLIQYNRLRVGAAYAACKASAGNGSSAFTAAIP